MDNFKKIFPENEKVEYASNAYKCAADVDILVILTEWEEFR
jgi:UDP-glucose 6-dehydrogenase